MSTFPQDGFDGPAAGRGAPPTGRREVARRPLWTWPVFVLVVLALGILSGFVGQEGSRNWYDQLNKSPLTPPDWAFSVVWTILYVAMATAAWLVWRRAGWAGARGALILFLLQLVANLAWSPIFFGLRSTVLGFVFILPVLVLVAATLFAFLRHDWRAGALFVPYLAWVAFATIVAWQTWQLNA